MTIFRISSKVLFFALCVAVVPVQAATIWDTISGWFDKQVYAAEKTADKMTEKVEEAATRVHARVHRAAVKAEKVVKANASKAGTTVTERIVRPVVREVQNQVEQNMAPVIKKGMKEVEKHAKPAIQRAVKTAVDEVEKQAQPAIARAEKRIQQNIARTVSRYMMAGLGGVVSFMAVRKAATAMTNDKPGSLGGWMHRQDASSSAFVSDIMIGAMLGMGAYGLWEQYHEEAVQIPQVVNQ